MDKRRLKCFPSDELQLENVVLSHKSGQKNPTCACLNCGFWVCPGGVLPGNQWLIQINFVYREIERSEGALPAYVFTQKFKNPHSSAVPECDRERGEWNRFKSQIRREWLLSSAFDCVSWNSTFTVSLIQENVLCGEKKNWIWQEPALFEFKLSTNQSVAGLTLWEQSDWSTHEHAGLTPPSETTMTFRINVLYF